jgi:hypothetical protein
MHIAELFLDAAIEHAEHGTDRAMAMIEAYFIGDPNEVSKRIWYWASVGPIIAAAGIRKLDIRPPGPGELWAIETLPGSQRKTDASCLAALQAVVGHLNEDESLAQDVTSAHFEVAGHEGLIAMSFECISLCSFLAKEGAFG